MARPSLIIVPGIQGRWEWLAPTIRALSREFDVHTFSLSDVNGDQPFEGWRRKIDELIDRSGSPRVVLVGVSFGGVIAAWYAGQRPDRVSSLVLVSTPAPDWRPEPRVGFYLRHPVLSTPIFAVRATRRFSREVMASKSTWPERATFFATYAYRVIRSPLAPPRMARWIKAWMATDVMTDCRKVTAPTLVITGEPGLDHVVPVTSSLAYLSIIPGAKHVVLPRTGHVGVVSRPAEFAQLVSAHAS